MVVPMIGERWIERLVHSWLEANHRVLDSCPFCGGVKFAYYASEWGDDLITDVNVLEEYHHAAMNDANILRQIEAVPMDYLESVERDWCSEFVLACECGARMRGDDVEDLILRWNQREQHEQC